MLMQALVDSFGSGALAGASATASGPMGTIAYVLIGISLFIVVALVAIYLIKMAKPK